MAHDSAETNEHSVNVVFDPVPVYDLQATILRRPGHR
jgi:hypothetical protein